MKELEFLYDKRGENDPYDRTGKRPMPLRSSWDLHERTPLPPRPPRVIYYLDDADGLTVGQSKTEESAYIIQREYRKQTGKRLVIRPFVIDEESEYADLCCRRKRSQYGY